MIPICKAPIEIILVRYLYEMSFLSQGRKKINAIRERKNARVQEFIWGDK